MSTAQFRTEADVMRNAANNVDDTNDSVNAELNRLQDVAQSTRDYWSGSAQASFDDLMVRFGDAERRLGEALGDIAECADELLECRISRDEMHGCPLRVFAEHTANITDDLAGGRLVVAVHIGQAGKDSAFIIDRDGEKGVSARFG